MCNIDLFPHYVRSKHVKKKKYLMALKHPWEGHEAIWAMLTQKSFNNRNFYIIIYIQKIHT